MTVWRSLKPAARQTGYSQWGSGQTPQTSTDSLTNHDAIREDQEGDIGCKGAENQPPCDHQTAEDGNGTSSKIHHTNTADGTWQQTTRCCYRQQAFPIIATFQPTHTRCLTHYESDSSHQRAHPGRHAFSLPKGQQPFWVEDSHSLWGTVTQQ